MEPILNKDRLQNLTILGFYMQGETKLKFFHMTTSVLESLSIPNCLEAPYCKVEKRNTENQ